MARLYGENPDECDETGGECCPQYPNFCCGCPLPSIEQRRDGPTPESLRRGIKHLRLTAQGVEKAYNRIVPPVKPSDQGK